MISAHEGNRHEGRDGDEERRSRAVTKFAKLMEQHDTQIDLTLGAGPLLRTGEVALLFGVSEHSIRKWADDGKLPYMRTLGRHRLFPAKEIARVLQEVSTGGATREITLVEGDTER